MTHISHCEKCKRTAKPTAFFQSNVEAGFSTKFTFSVSTHSRSKSPASLHLTIPQKLHLTKSCVKVMCAIFFVKRFQTFFSHFKIKQGRKLTFLGRRQLATDLFFSVAKWENVATSCEILVASAKFLCRIGDQESVISDPVKVCLSYRTKESSVGKQYDTL